jgi:hypothetical protein
LKWGGSKAAIFAAISEAEAVAHRARKVLGPPTLKQYADLSPTRRSHPSTDARQQSPPTNAFWQQATELQGLSVAAPVDPQRAISPVARRVPHEARWVCRMDKIVASPCSARSRCDPVPNNTSVILLEN